MMFTTEERDSGREHLLARTQARGSSMSLIALVGTEGPC